MITQKDQDDLFLLIAKKLDADIACVAFGGTAMMYYDYKQATKDIDLVFKTINDRKKFIRAIQSLGYKEKEMLLNIYSKEKRIDTSAPVMYVLKDERFDLFAESIFKVVVSETMLKRSSLLKEFKSERASLKIHIISPEDLVLLKALTDRANDYEDIKTILSKKEAFNWEGIIDEALSQKDGWVLLDLEETMKKLVEEGFDIPKKYFEKLYGKK
ncbi:MAG: DUF6036 family nucleotidyltransferase [Candidatus Woesearchaeota archaeon]